MKLLLYAAQEGIDQALMVVPEEYDREMADQEATDFLGECNRVSEVRIWDDDLDFSNYRVYVG